MNLLIAITDKYAGLPLWAWIVIAAVVLIAIIIIAVVAAKIARAKKQNATYEEEDEEEFSAPADDATPVEQTVAAKPAQEAPAPQPKEKAEPEKPAPVTAQKAAPAPAAKPAQPAAKPAAAPAPAARPAQPAAKPAAKSEPVRPAAETEEEKQIEEIAKTSGPKVYHITKRLSDGKWQIKFNKGKKAIKLFDTQVQAIEYAKALAQNQEGSIMIHKEDGTFRKLRYDKPNK